MKFQDHQCAQQENDLEQFPEIGDRIIGKSASPDESTVRDWIGPEAFEHWSQLQSWIDLSGEPAEYGVFCTLSPA